MRKEIKETEIRRLNRYGNIYAALLALTVLSAVPLAAWMGWYALIPWAALAGVTMYFAVKVEKVKKDNDIHTKKSSRLRKDGGWTRWRPSRSLENVTTKRCCTRLEARQSVS